MTVNAETLERMGVSRHLAQEWGPRFEEELPKHGIDTKQREQHFLGQVLHESGMLRYTDENLNYSAEGLLATFPKYFNPLQAKEYERQPERIANRVYASRMGNGDEASGDGWRYRGRGFIQLTGYDNHESYAQWEGAMVPLPREDMDPLMTAIYYWKTTDLNRFADADDAIGLTKAINGWYNGLDDRLALTNLAGEVLA